MSKTWLSFSLMVVGILLLTYISIKRAGGYRCTPGREEGCTSVYKQPGTPVCTNRPSPVAS